MKRTMWRVIWDDPSYPMIVPWEPGFADALTFTEAKAEVDGYFADLCRHNHYQRDLFRRMTQAQCLKEWSTFTEEDE